MRIYGRARGCPQVIASCKSFSGPTGLEEYLGGGFGIALDVRVEGGELHFLSNTCSGGARACGCACRAGSLPAICA
jgi:hypothetical protein